MKVKVAVNGKCSIDGVAQRWGQHSYSRLEKVKELLFDLVGQDILHLLRTAHLIGCWDIHS